MEEDVLPLSSALINLLLKIVEHTCLELFDRVVLEEKSHSDLVVHVPRARLEHVHGLTQLGKVAFPD